MAEVRRQIQESDRLEQSLSYLDSAVSHALHLVYDRDKTSRAALVRFDIEVARSERAGDKKIANFIAEMATRPEVEEQLALRAEHHDE